MAHTYKIRDQAGLYYLTLQVVRWVDIFTRRAYRDLIIDSLKFCQQQKGLNLYAYVIMSNHIHLIVSAKDENLSDIIRDLKGFTSKKILEMVKTTPESRRDWMLWLFEDQAKNHKRNSHFQIWTHENHAIELQSNKFMDQKLEYIHQNPVRNGIVETPEDYMYSSARNYCGLPGLIDVLYIE